MKSLLTISKPLIKIKKKIKTNMAVVPRLGDIFNFDGHNIPYCSEWNEFRPWDLNKMDIRKG